MINWKVDKMIPIAKPIMGEEEKKAVLEVLDSGMLAQGEYVAKFEEKFAKYIGVDYGVAVTSGTSALLTALHCLDIKGKVIVPSFTFFASVSSVYLTGLEPVFVDIDPKTFNMDLDDVKKKITPDVKAIMPVHLFGQSCNMDAIMELAEDKGLKVIEDACQSHGARWGDKRVGSFGDVGCFSFYPTKNITSGEGGMVMTNDEKLAEKMRAYRNHGQTSRYEHESFGYNYHMTNINAALGLAQLKHLDGFIAKRRENADYYNKHLDGVTTPFVQDKAFHVYNQYTIRTEDREGLIERLKANGIGYGIYYPIPAHKQPVINSSAQLPETEKACKEVISLPVHPALSKEDLEKVVEVVKSP